MIKDINIIKASGEIEKFSKARVISSLKKSGADEKTIQNILNQLDKKIYEGISTKEIYKLAFKNLSSTNSVTASKYKLKQAIFKLGPSGFPFERFIGAIFKEMGYEVETGKIIKGKCVDHEIDVITYKDGLTSMMECKFHSDQGRKCDVKITLYIDARFKDIMLKDKKLNVNQNLNKSDWVVTNTRFTNDAIKYSTCVGLNLLSWDRPKGKALKDLIDQTGLYPITVSTLLTLKEIQFLLSNDVVLCKELISNSFLLENLQISEHRKSRILNEMKMICAII